MQKKKENFRSLRSVTTFALAAAIITGRRDKLGSSADSEADCIGVAEKCESERTGRDRLLLCLFCRKSSAGNG